MSKELEIAGGASIGGWLRWRKKHAVEPGSPCANCETPLQGSYCHVCGQLAEDFHKSVWHLITEALESFFHWDGRLAHTFPKMIFQPARLTRAFLDGKRANQVPPLRLFLVLLLIAFFVGECSARQSGVQTNLVGPKGAAAAKIKEDVRADLAKEGLVIGPDGKVGVTGYVAQQAGKEARRIARKDAKLADPKKREVGSWRNPAFGKTAVTVDPKAEKANDWIKDRVAAIQKDPKRFGMILMEWAHRLAILALPVSALILTVLFIFQRRFYVYDHLIFSMHSLSFQLLLLSIMMGLGPITGGWIWWLILLMPAHLFVHMRGTYGISAVGTLIRMFLLFWGSLFAFSFLAIGWLLIGANEMVSH